MAQLHRLVCGCVGRGCKPTGESNSGCVREGAAIIQEIKRRPRAGFVVEEGRWCRVTERGGWKWRPLAAVFLREPWEQDFVSTSESGKYSELELRSLRHRAYHRESSAS